MHTGILQKYMPGFVALVAAIVTDGCVSVERRQRVLEAAPQVATGSGKLYTVQFGEQFLPGVEWLSAALQAYRDGLIQVK